MTGVRKQSQSDALSTKNGGPFQGRLRPPLQLTPKIGWRWGSEGWDEELRIGADSDPSLLAAPVERAPGLRAGVLSLRDYDHAVHDHVGYPDGILHGVLEGRLVAHGLGIEDGDVRRHAGAQHAAVGKAGDLGGKRGHLANGVRQR